MTSSPVRPALALSVLAAFAAGCATGSTGSVRRELSAKPIEKVVTSDDIERSTGQQLEEILQAKVPGLLATRTPGGGLSLRIRGISSYMSSNEPLIVIDDVPLQAGPSGLTAVNPHDIESIRVLKNPADIGIYGVRGANGVILIRTKKPGRRGR